MQQNKNQSENSQPETDGNETTACTAFESINLGFNTVFRPNRLSLGLVVPIESYASTAVPALSHHLERIQLAEELGFAAIWLRDVPFNVPSFGDAGQLFDPFTYLGYLAGRTRHIALGVASIILPLRHPAHVAKAAATADVLSGGRLILGVASGDRPEEYPALNFDYTDRGAKFRESFAYIRQMARSLPEFENAWGRVDSAIDMLPKPAGSRLPLLITGGSQQNLAWIAEHGDGWMTYPRAVSDQARAISNWQAGVTATGSQAKPVLQPLYLDLTEDPGSPPQPIHLGFRCGIEHLRSYLKTLQEIGVHHVAINLRFNRRGIDETVNQLAEGLLPEFGP